MGLGGGTSSSRYVSYESGTSLKNIPGRLAVILATGFVGLSIVQKINNDGTRLISRSYLDLKGREREVIRYSVPIGSDSIFVQTDGGEYVPMNSYLSKIEIPGYRDGEKSKIEKAVEWNE